MLDLDANFGGLRKKVKSRKKRNVCCRYMLWKQTSSRQIVLFIPSERTWSSYPRRGCRFLFVFFFRAFVCGMLPSNTRGWVLSSVRLWLVIFRSLSSTTWSSSWKLLINSTCRQAQGRLTDWVAVLFVKPEWGVGNPGVKFIKFFGAIELQFDRPLDKPRVPAESKQ